MLLLRDQGERLRVRLRHLGTGGRELATFWAGHGARAGEIESCDGRCVAGPWGGEGDRLLRLEIVERIQTLRRSRAVRVGSGARVIEVVVVAGAGSAHEMVERKDYVQIVSGGPGVGILTGWLAVGRGRNGGLVVDGVGLVCRVRRSAR